MPTLFLGILLGTFCRIDEVEITGRRSRRPTKALASTGRNVTGTTIALKGVMTKTKAPLTVPMTSRHARLARHVLRQALYDVTKRMQVDIDNLRPWAIIAGIPQSSLEKRFLCASRQVVR